jgi:parallel beta-helix repeat protein
MNVKIISLYLIMGALFFSVITTGLFGLTILASSTARTLYVPDNYASIQEAIDAAQVGDTIKVRAGLYYENLLVYKSITIQGEDWTSTIVQGDGSSAAVWIQANNVVVSGFTIKNGGQFYSGISIGMYGACKNVTICENVIKNTVEGITVWWYSSHVTISRNYISGSECGIGFDNSTDNMINDNVLIDNHHGVMMAYCENNTFVGNTFRNNEHSGVHFEPCCYNNTMLHNNFINSPVDNHESINIWDNGFEGNYYSDYKGEDANKDGLGDTPHQIDIDNIDNFPLMEPWSLVRTYDAFVWNERTYKVNIQTDSIVAAFNFTYSLRQISFNVTGCKGEAGFCNVTVPNLLLIGKPWQVRIDGTSISFNKVENETHTSLYFALTFSTHMIKIAGTQALEKIPPHADAGSD